MAVGSRVDREEDRRRQAERRDVGHQLQVLAERAAASPPRDGPVDAVEHPAGDDQPTDDREIRVGEARSVVLAHAGQSAECDREESADDVAGGHDVGERDLEPSGLQRRGPMAARRRTLHAPAGSGKITRRRMATQATGTRHATDVHVRDRGPVASDGAAASGARRAVRRQEIRPATVVLIASLGMFMAFVDHTVVSVAFPNLLRSFPDAGLSTLSWVISAYNIVFAAFLLPAGRVADVLGRRRVFAAGILVFTVASLACAVAPTVTALIVARAVQALGAAIIVPSSLALVLHAFPGEQRGKGVALWSASAALAAGL